MNLLPGWHPGFFASAAGGGLTPVQFIASSISAGVATITAPANIQAGDLLIILQRASDDDSSPPTAVTPSGFLTANNVSNTTGGKKPFSSRQILNYKLATGAEASQVFSIMDGSDVDADTDERAIFLVFRGASPIASVTLQDVDGVMDSSNPAAQTITANLGTPPLVVIGAYGKFDSDLVNASMNPAGTLVSNLVGNNNDVALIYKIYNTAPLSTVVDLDGSSDDVALQSCYFELS